MWGIHRGPVNSLHKGPVPRKKYPFDDVIMLCPRFKEVEMRVYWFHVRPSGRPSVRGGNLDRSVSSTILAGSISYLIHLIEQLRKVCLVLRVLQTATIWILAIFKICNLGVLFWLWIQYESLVRVIMGRRRVFSECLFSWIYYLIFCGFMLNGAVNH